MKTTGKGSVVQASETSAPPAIIAAVAHELKTPLAVVAQLASCLRDDQVQLSCDDQERYLRRIELTTERMLRLIEGLTTTYRLEQADQLAFQLEVEPVNAAQVCEEAAHELTPLAAQLEQTIHWQAPSRSRLVVAHPDLLRNVVLNLMDNALKHNPAHTTVRLGLQGRDQRVRVLVHDNGPGMSRAEFRGLQQRLGHQTQPSLLRSGSSGLGLYVAGRLTAAMGGSLGARRHQQSGMTFFVELHSSRQLQLF